jgi:hypothetical protein
MTSLEDVSIEVPMSEGVFFEIISQLSNYPVRRLHLCLSAEGLGVFLTTPAGRNDLPSGFSPKWLAYISRSLKHLEELVLDYRSGGTFLELVWPGDQVCLYAHPKAQIPKLTWAINIVYVRNRALSSSKPTHTRDIYSRITSKRLG